MRTYAGHSTAEASNKLFKTNLSKGQTGLSIAFDLPTQTGYDSDHILSEGEVGKVGVPISNMEDMLALFNGIPLDKMNTSMTINATAAWLLALYCATAEENNVELKNLQGTTQNDIIKEYSTRTKTVCGKISGTLSAVDLFQRLHKFRKKGQALIIDDTDKILETTESLEVLKSALGLSLLVPFLIKLQSSGLKSLIM